MCTVWCVSFVTHSVSQSGIALLTLWLIPLCAKCRLCMYKKLCNIIIFLSVRLCVCYLFTDFRYINCLFLFVRLFPHLSITSLQWAICPCCSDDLASKPYIVKQNETFQNELKLISLWWNSIRTIQYLCFKPYHVGGRGGGLSHATQI